MFGHRGVRGAAPENTMAAFELARTSGADGVELDVRVCRTGELVVCHDATLERYTKNRDPRAVADLAFSDLRAIDVGDGERVPLLDDVLAWATAHDLRVNVEMKRDVPRRRDVVRQTARALAGLGAKLPTIIVSSFDPWMLAYFAWLLPGVLRGSLFASDQRLVRSGWPARVLRTEAVHPDRTLVDERRFSKWKSAGRLVNVWTVNDPAEARALAALGVDAIITDVPKSITESVR